MRWKSWRGKERECDKKGEERLGECVRRAHKAREEGLFETEEEARQGKEDM